ELELGLGHPRMPGAGRCAASPSPRPGFGRLCIKVWLCETVPQCPTCIAKKCKVCAGGDHRRLTHFPSLRSWVETLPLERLYPGPATCIGPTNLATLLAQEVLQRFGQGRGAGVAIGRLLGQTLQANGFQFVRHVGMQLPRYYRFFARDLPGL